MIKNIDSTIPVVIPVRPIERAGEGAVEPKAVSVPATAAPPVTRNYDFQFRVNSETDELTAVILDPETGAVIREVPAKEMHAAADVIRSLIGPRINKVA